MANARNSGQRRNSGRLVCRGVHIHADDSFAGTVLDISATGMRVLAPADPRDMEGSWTFALTSQSETVEVVAERVWSRQFDEGVYEIGFRFVGANEATRRRLFDLFRNAA